MSQAKKSDELTQFAADLQLMRGRAINLRLYATRQRLDSALRTLGLEIAGDTYGYCKYGAIQAAPRRGREFHCSLETPCPDCGSTEGEMRTHGGSWDDADCHCAQCGKLIYQAWSAM
jgi:hypothetical protein